MSKFIEPLNQMSDEKRAYALESFPTHLAEGGKTKRWRELLINFDFIEAKILALDSQSLIADYDLGPSDETLLASIQKGLTQNGHLFDQCERLGELAATLYSRLHAIPDLVSLIPRLEATLSPPYLIPRHPLPDLPHPALLRTLTGHTKAVLDCAISQACPDFGAGWTGHCFRLI